MANIETIAREYADKIDGYINPKALIFYFAEQLSSKFYFVDKADAKQLFQSYNNYPEGWTENSEICEDLIRIIPELSDNDF